MSRDDSGRPRAGTSDEPARAAARAAPPRRRRAGNAADLDGEIAAGERAAREYRQRMRELLFAGVFGCSWPRG